MSRRTKWRGWTGLRDYALTFPGAWEDFPWEEVVVKVGKKVFVFLGREGSTPAAVSVKLTYSRDHALSRPGAAPTGYGLGKAGWVTLRVKPTAEETDLLLDWIEESYRNVAPKKLVRELDQALAAGQ